ncbi:MAG: HlyD family efflux transporter periplasmic adaptor subunit, partial [Planctomycetales bacterium]|nr:HlyD family efflux transporter periplasmic adaptor subunit [Planctomycetales bacterium]
EVVTQQQFEQQRLLVDKMKDDLRQARFDLESSLESAKLGIDAAKADLNMATVAAENIESTIPTGSLQKKSELAQQQFDMTQIVSPIDARVIRTFLREKELIGNSPVFQLAATDKMICVAEVYESNLRFVDEGQRVTINSPALPVQLSGTVSKKGSVIGSPTLKNPSPLARVDRRTAEVEITLDDDSIETAKQFISLQVNVKIDTTASTKESDIN